MQKGSYCLEVIKLRISNQIQVYSILHYLQHFDWNLSFLSSFLWFDHLIHSKNLQQEKMIAEIEFLCEKFNVI